MKLVKILYDANELSTPGVAAAPVTPPAVDPSAAAPITPPTDEPPATPDPATEGTIAAVKAERTRRQAAELAAQNLREQVAFLEGQRSAAPVPATHTVPAVAEPAGPPAAPRIEDYEDDFAGWQAADRQHIIDVATYNAEQRFEARQQSQRQQSQVEQSARTFQDRLAKAAETDPDLPNIASTFHLRGPSYIPLTPQMQEAILESDVGPKLLRFFADNKAEAARLSALSPTSAMREIGRVEAQILATPKPVPPAVISLAPEPITTVSGSPSAGSITELKDMDMASYFKIRAPQITKRR
jgi:hypothetical protein